VHSAPNGFRSIVNSDIVIVEGHLLFTSDRILSYVDFLIYIDIDERIAKERRFSRDVVERGYTLEDCESYYMEYVESQLESIGDLKSKADYIIGNHVLKDVLNDHVETLSALLTK
jgi:uridine kinase